MANENDGNTISDLRTHLFATIRDLRNPESKMDVETAKAIKGVADSIIESAKAEVRAHEVLGTAIGAGVPSFMKLEAPKK